MSWTILYISAQTGSSIMFSQAHSFFSPSFSSKTSWKPSRPTQLTTPTNVSSLTMALYDLSAVRIGRRKPPGLHLKRFISHRTPPFRLAGHPVCALGSNLAASIFDMKGNWHILKVFVYVLPSTQKSVSSGYDGSTSPSFWNLFTRETFQPFTLLPSTPFFHWWSPHMSGFVSNNYTNPPLQPHTGNLSSPDLHLPQKFFTSHGMSSRWNIS